MPCVTAVREDVQFTSQVHMSGHYSHLVWKNSPASTNEFVRLYTAAMRYIGAA